MFDLQFLSGPEPDQDEPDAVFLRGRITIGDFSEEFRAPAYTWQAADYERHWLAAGRRLVGGAPQVGFITHFAHREASYHFWWPAWREGETVYIQHHLVLVEQLAEPFDPLHADRHVQPRETSSEDGGRISEWTVTARDIADFVRRLERSPIGAV